MKKKTAMEISVSRAHVHSITKASNHLYAYNILKEATNSSRKEEIITAATGEIICIKPAADIDSTQFMTKKVYGRQTSTPISDVIENTSIPRFASHIATSRGMSPKTGLATREVIKIDGKNIIQGSDIIDKKNFLGMKKTKRKKGCIDEILLQVEAKKRKEELMSQTVEKVADVIPPKTTNKISATEKDFSIKTRTPLSNNNPTPSSVANTKTEYSRTNDGYDVIPKDKLLEIRRNYEPLNSPPSNTVTYRNDIEYRLQPNMKYSVFYDDAHNNKLTNNNSCTEKRQPVHFPVPPSSSSDQNLDHNKNEMKNENLSRKKKRLAPNERYSNLTNSQLQRRLVANARERSRVHALSNAFDTLRSAIPSYSPEQKISKLTILRVAINYINALQEILHSDTMNIFENRSFVSNVNECSCVLQTEYGRSKMKLTMD